jgi:hypothetical protein
MIEFLAKEKPHREPGYGCLWGTITRTYLCMLY